ncbi:MAG TPA: DUF2460 domain-containing protein, partial [Sphingomicrobium sp.]|nr:DUF2460 domain-containing protein [Sphingomicrobium sp.]
IWDSEDRDAHPAHARETSRDYSGCVLQFRWRSTGLIPLNAVNGPTLTIEGRDANGAERSWYVRLWNYASGSATNAVITLDFDELDGGFLLPAEAERVDPRFIDRLFFSLVPPGYDPASNALIGAPAAATLHFEQVVCDGPGSVLTIRDAMTPEHDLRVATAYDDQYHLPPERVLRTAHRLGYRKLINHYVGMSHYMALGAGGLVDPAIALNAPALAWHRGFARAAKALGFEIIWSLSYEILDQFCPEEWKQRRFDGTPAATGYDPPSALVSPAKAEAIAFLGSVAAALAQLAVDEGLEPQIQIGEPWWWVTPDHQPCLYDDAAKAALGGSPIDIGDVRGGKTPQEIALLDAAGALLAQSTAAIVAAAKAAQPATRTHLLAYLPGPLSPAAPELRRANLPVGWADPAFDVLQLEDYEWVTGGRRSLREAAYEIASLRLGYPPARQHYLSGFAAPGAAEDWASIMAAAREARERDISETFIWALPQIVRDGLTLFGKETNVTPFEDVEFPIAIGAEASAAPGFSTNVVTSASGHEQRNANWQQARLRFDAGPGVRGDAELGELLTFFRARRGSAVAFRFRDPFDHSSNGMTGAPSATDQLIGIGDGAKTRFALVKTYGEGERRQVTRPVAGSVRVSVDDVEQATGWTIEPLGVVQFTEPPAAGEEIRAGFLFDTPVRFAEDRLDVNRASFLAGEAPSVPLIEVRED